MTRRGGLLLHPTSLPGPYGLGDLGPTARELLAFMESAGLTVWQMLPIGPVDAMGSPYSASSAFAGEPLLIAIDDLVSDGWLHPSEVEECGGTQLSLDLVAARRAPMLALATSRVARSIPLDRWVTRHPWATDWALWCAISTAFGSHWPSWPEGLAHRSPEALAAFRDQHASAVDAAVAAQWLFARQWESLVAAARSRGVKLWGDLPILVEHGSADIWSRPEGWRLDARGAPTVVSGVPPDGFSPDGQRWGHPLPDLAAHRADGHAWWTARAATTFARFDAVRIDHFRGFAGLWEIPATGAPKDGRWGEGLGADALDALLAAAPTRPKDVVAYAEDLGVITPDVVALRDSRSLPGTVVLQFAFGEPGAAHPFLPARHTTRQVVFTGTHDNDTLAGWVESLGPDERARVAQVVGPGDLADGLLRATWESVADTAIVPIQDLLGLGPEARMNWPGRRDGNWRWRLTRNALDAPLAEAVRKEIGRTGRLPA